MKVVIVGGGVGGLALARGLVARGVEVEVHERGPALRTGGAGIALYANGHAALRGLGVDIGDLGRRLDALVARDSTGRTRLTADIGSGRARFGHEARTVPRRAVLERLAAGLPEGVVRFDRTCTGVRTADGGATALFADGDHATGDVVVGADGVHSALRRVLVDHAAARPMRWASWQALTPVPVSGVGGTDSFVVQGRQGACGIMPAGDGLVQWWFDVRWRPGTPVPAAPAAVLRRLFGSWTDPDVRTILDHARDEDLSLFAHVRHRVPKVWGRGPTTLLGDAAHAFPPATAQGANQALEDAWVLTRALADERAPGDPAEAVRRYERARRGPVSIASVASTLQVSSRVQPSGAVGERLGPLATRRFNDYLERVSNVLTDRRP